MTNAKTVTFNLNRVIEILHNGIRRADVFMGIGLNAAEADPAISHVLSLDSFHKIDLVKTDLTPIEKAHVASEFGKWIRANGLRELIETLSLFLDTLYLPLFAMHRGMDPNGKKLILPIRLEKLGIIDKMNAMSDVLPLSNEDKTVLGAMNRMRNCYAHRRGIVGQRDMEYKADVMTVRWIAFQIQVKESNGNIILEAELYDRVIEKGGVIQLKIVERIRSFKVGDELILEKRDLKEICLSALAIGQRMLQTTTEKARAFGILKEAEVAHRKEPKAI